MISFDCAYEIAMTAARPLGVERAPIEECLNRVLAEDVRSDVDSPPFDKAAMDGYACRRQDLSNELTVVEEIPAGYFPNKSIGVNECARIMTGAPVPAGADVVIMFEDVESAGPEKIRFAANATSRNICSQGEDVKVGDAVLRQGTRLTTACLAVLSAAGNVHPLVARRPRVGVVATGNEIIEPSGKPSGAAIRDSNSVQLCAQIRNMGAIAHYCGIAQDDPTAIESVVRKAMAENDAILLSGGVSAGKYDFVPDVLKTCGFELKFQSVAMQPGKPTLFGVGQSAYCWGLPGNPVSTFVVFEILVRPFLYRLMGHDHKARAFPAILESEVQRRKTERQLALPVVFTPTGGVIALEYHGSAHIRAMSEADGLLILPAGIARIEKGATVHVRPI